MKSKLVIGSCGIGYMLNLNFELSFALAWTLNTLSIPTPMPMTYADGEEILAQGNSRRETPAQRLTYLLTQVTIAPLHNWSKLHKVVNLRCTTIACLLVCSLSFLCPNLSLHLQSLVCAPYLINLFCPDLSFSLWPLVHAPHVCLFWLCVWLTPSPPSVSWHPPSVAFSRWVPSKPFSFSVLMSNSYALETGWPLADVELPTHIEQI
jgi:hypothetical protein